MNKFIGKNFSLLIFFLIVLVAIFLRFDKLGLNPPSLDWDEASLGYNAYSILKTGADEYGNKFPLSIRSFDDYKPPLYVYLDIPFIAFFGLNELSVRLPSAILGVLTVMATYFLVKEFLEKWEKRLKEWIALCSAFFLAVSPWHLQFSRAAFEGNIGLFFFSVGVLFFLKALKNDRLFILSGLFIVLSLYSYHSFRLITPLIIFLAIVIFWQEIRQKKYFIIFIAILLVFSLPVFKNFISSSGAEARLSMVTIFNASEETLGNSIKEMEYDKRASDIFGSLLHNRRIVYSLATVKGYLDHFNPDFLFLHGDGGRQHHAVNVGMLYLWDLPFILIGIFFLLKKIDKRLLLLFLWFLIAPFPSAISSGTPHPVRAINMIPAFQIFSAVGLISVIYKIKELRQPLLSVLSIIFIFLAFILNVAYYLHQYYIHTPIEYGDFWQYGHKQVFQEVSKIENNYSRIIMTYRYDQPYIFYLFYNKIDPVWYQKNWDSSGSGKVERMVRKIGKYEFRNISWAQDQNLSNVLLIGTPEEIPREKKKIIKEVKFLDGKIAFRIVER